MANCRRKDRNQVCANQCQPRRGAARPTRLAMCRAATTARILDTQGLDTQKRRPMPPILEAQSQRVRAQRQRRATVVHPDRATGDTEV